MATKTESEYDTAIALFRHHDANISKYISNLTLYILGLAITGVNILHPASHPKLVFINLVFCVLILLSTVLTCIQLAMSLRVRRTALQVAQNSLDNQDDATTD